MWAKKKAVGKPGLANTLLPLQVNEQPRRRPRARPRPPSAPPAGFPMKISPADPQSQTLLVLDSLLASPSPTALLPNSGFGPCDTHSLSAVGGRLGVPGPPLHRQRGTELICFGQSQEHCRPQRAKLPRELPVECVRRGLSSPAPRRRARGSRGHRAAAGHRPVSRLP